jgi:hypothetical protein
MPRKRISSFVLPIVGIIIITLIIVVFYQFSLINQLTKHVTTATSTITTITSKINCGGYRQICCTSGSLCNAGFSCQAGLCQPCGGVGNGCCSGHTCNYGLSCDTTHGINPPDGVCVSTGCDPVICNNDCKWANYTGTCKNSTCYCNCVNTTCDLQCKNSNYQNGGYCLTDSPCLEQNGGGCSSNCQCRGSPTPPSISKSTTTSQIS